MQFQNVHEESGLLKPAPTIAPTSSQQSWNATLSRVHSLTKIIVTGICGIFIASSLLMLSGSSMASFLERFVPPDLPFVPTQPSRVAHSSCGALSRAMFADMHDGYQKEVSLVHGNKLTIKPVSKDEKWIIRALVDLTDCTAMIDFDVPGKPSPPPVPLMATLWDMETVSAIRRQKVTIEFTDPSETIASKGYPLNHWVLVED